MNLKDIEPSVQKLNTGLLELMKQISVLSSKDKRYPKTSEAFNTAFEHLKHPSYDVVVCGEVKKGKSSLLNAIIGQNILPVDTDVATSQVFRISNSEKESFSLVFTDGTIRPIEREQLATFGSQVIVNQNGGVNLGNRILSHIQVNVPVQFLPAHVNLVDTPGLGAVYKSHEWLTQNYVKRAAAVLFVFEASQPMVELERTFINKVLDITPHVMFVMTKIDTVVSSVWKTQLNRIEESLATIFAERKLPAPTVFPISSRALMNAAEEDEEDFKMVNIRDSMFPAVKDELMSMIVRTMAMSHTSIALYESQGQILNTKTVITNLLKAAAEEGQYLDQQFKDNKLAKQRELQKEWGENSRQTNDIANKISQICNIVSNRVIQIFRPTSPIREHYVSQIDAITSMDEVREMCNNMPSAVANDIAQQWESIMCDAVDEVSAILQNAMSDIDRASIDDVDAINIGALNITPSQRLNSIRNIVGTGMLATGIATIVFPPIGVLVGIGATIWAWFAGKSDEVQRNKANLKQKLNEQMDQIDHALRDARGYNQVSVVDEFIGSLKKSAERTINGAVNTKKQEMEEQLQALEEQAQKSLTEKRAECEHLKTDLASWNALVEQTKKLCELRESIERQISE